MARTVRGNDVAQLQGSPGRKRVALFVTIVTLALALNVLAWAAAAWRPSEHGTWAVVGMTSFFLLGAIIGRWWALLVTCAYGVIHAIPVYLGLLPGYLSTWGEALWWVFALTVLLALTSLGVLSRAAVRRLRERSRQ